MSSVSVNRNNLLAIIGQTASADWYYGLKYYDTQYSNLEAFSDMSGIPVDRVVAAFSALSPNNAESTNYRALASCIAIAKGQIPDTAPVIAFGNNKLKALDLLKRRRLVVEEIVTGRKTYAFYRNTMNPDDAEFVTIDGHMYNAWKGQVIRLQATGMTLTSAMYKTVSSDLKAVARQYSISPARFQSILWLTWKRINHIVSSDQLPLESGINRARAKLMIDQSPSSRIIFPREGGPFIKRDTCTTPRTQSHLEFGEDNTLTV